MKLCPANGAFWEIEHAHDIRCPECSEREGIGQELDMGTDPVRMGQVSRAQQERAAQQEFATLDRNSEKKPAALTRVSDKSMAVAWSCLVTHSF